MLPSIFQSKWNPTRAYYGRMGLGASKAGGDTTINTADWHLLPSSMSRWRRIYRSASYLWWSVGPYLTLTQAWNHSFSAPNAPSRGKGIGERAKLQVCMWGQSRTGAPGSPREVRRIRCAPRGRSSAPGGGARRPLLAQWFILLYNGCDWVTSSTGWGSTHGDAQAGADVRVAGVRLIVAGVRDGRGCAPGAPTSFFRYIFSSIFDFEMDTNPVLEFRRTVQQQSVTFRTTPYTRCSNSSRIEHPV